MSSPKIEKGGTWKWDSGTLVFINLKVSAQILSLHHCSFIHGSTYPSMEPLNIGHLGQLNGNKCTCDTVPAPNTWSFLKNKWTMNKAESVVV